MLPDYFAVIGAFIASAGGFYYLYETIIGKTKPNRMTWFLWGALPMITFFAQRVQGVEGLSWISFVAGFTPLLIVLASFLNKKAYWKTERRDYFVMVGALIGITLWAVTKNPNLAILFALIADIIAALPTIIKSYKHPETESWVAYAISAFGFGIGILSIQTYTFENYAFVIYLFITQFTLAVLASRKSS